MKKIILMMMASVICFFTSSVQSIANAKILPPLFYKSNFIIEDTSTTQNEKDLMAIVYDFRYIDTITITNINNYIKLLNIQADTKVSTTDLQKVFLNLGYSSTNFAMTNKANNTILYIIYYQTKYKAQLNQKIAQFNDSQKKQYLAIAYNMKLASLQYNLSKNNLTNYQQRINDPRFKSIIIGLGYNENISNEVYKNIAIVANSNNLKLVLPDVNANVPKNSSNLYEPDKTIKITQGIVQSKEADAIIQWTNIKLSEGQNLSNVDLSLAWGTKAAAKKFKGDYSEALKCYNKAIELNPAEYVFWANRGFAKWSLADFNGAISDYNKAIAFGLKKPEDYYNRACAKVVTGRYNEAADDFKKVYQLTQGTKSAQLGIVSLTYSKGLTEGSAEAIKNKILLDNPLVFGKYIEKTSTFPINLGHDSSSSTPKTTQTVQNQTKSVCPPGCRVYLIIGRLKNSHTEVRYTTIAQITKIEDIVNADTRFEWVRYETVPDSYLDRYPRY